MTAGHADTVERAPPPTVNGLPTWVGDEGDKQARKAHKREAKLRRELERWPDSFERFRILMEAVSEGRQVVDLATTRRGTPW